MRTNGTDEVLARAVNLLLGRAALAEIRIVRAALGHERRFRDIHDASGLSSTPERLRQRSEPTLRARGCLRDDVGITAGVPQIAADSLQRPMSAALGLKP